MCKSLEFATTLIDTITNIKETYEFNFKNVNDLDRETQDLEHEIELSEFDVYKGYELAKEFQRVRQERRRLNDENSTLKFLQDYFESPNFKKMVSELQKIRGNIKKEQEKLDNRLYTPRIRNDLTIPTREKDNNINTIDLRKEA